MSKLWKWILGILLVVVVLGALVTVGFALRGRFGGMYVNAPLNQRGVVPMQRGNDWGRAPMMNNNQQYQMMGGRGRSFGGGFFLLGGLVKLVFFGLLLYGAYWLGRRNARIALDPKPVARVDEAAVPKAEA